jgi:molybdenum cofactor biosynthesis enzyme MoaA
MANLVVADACNLKCAYCFARDHMQASKDNAAPAFISLATFEARLDFLDRSGIGEIRLIGGEPTLHPQFPEMIRRARRGEAHCYLLARPARKRWPACRCHPASARCSST